MNEDKYTTCKYCSNVIVEETDKCPHCNKWLRFGGVELLELLKYKICVFFGCDYERYAFEYRVVDSRYIPRNEKFFYPNEKINFFLDIKGILRLSLYSLSLSIFLLVIFNNNIDILLLQHFEISIDMDKRIDLSIYLPVILPIFLFFLFLSYPAVMLIFFVLPGSILSLICNKIDDKINPEFERFEPPKESIAELILFGFADVFNLKKKKPSIDDNAYDYILISNNTLWIEKIVIDAISTSDDLYDQKKSILLIIQQVLSFVERKVEYISFISFRTFCSFVKNILLSIVIFSITGGIIISPFIIMNKLNFYLIKPEYYSSFPPVIRNCELFFFLFWGGIFSWFVTWLYFQAEFYIVTKKENKKWISYLKEKIDEIDARISEQQDKMKVTASE